MLTDVGKQLLPQVLQDRYQLRWMEKKVGNQTHLVGIYNGRAKEPTEVYIRVTIPSNVPNAIADFSFDTFDPGKDNCFIEALCAVNSIEPLTEKDFRKLRQQLEAKHTLYSFINDFDNLRRGKFKETKNHRDGEDVQEIFQRAGRNWYQAAVEIWKKMTGGNQEYDGVSLKLTPTQPTVTNPLRQLDFTFPVHASADGYLRIRSGPASLRMEMDQPSLTDLFNNSITKGGNKDKAWKAVWEQYGDHIQGQIQQLCTSNHRDSSKIPLDRLLAYVRYSFVAVLLSTFRLGAGETAHDIVHEVLINFYERWPQSKAQVETVDDLHAYLRRSCRNCLIDRYRRERRAEGLVDFLLPGFGRSNEIHPDRIILANEILTSLPKECATFLRQIIRTGLSPAELADKLGASPAAFYSRWHRCLEKARQKFSEKKTRT
jgi:RNA polymerase sigma factor (sigma-70 family)